MLPDVVNEEEVNLREYLRVRDAAKILGIHPDTLRRWEKTDQLRTYRHPVNRYRLYRRVDLEQLLQKVRPS